MALRRGDYVGIYAVVSSTPTIIASERSCSLDFTQEVIDVTSKSDNGQFAGIAGPRQQVLTFEGLYDDADGAQGELIDAIKDGTNVTVHVYEDLNGTPASIDSATGILQNVNITWDRGDAATISGTVMITGTPLDLTA